MKSRSYYIDLDGDVIPLEGLDASERKLLSRVQTFAATEPSWDEFDNFYIREVARFYDTRKLPRAKLVKSPIFLIGKDLSSRIALAAGKVREGDDLEWLIRDNFKSQREFCKATGLAEDMLSHVLAGRKHLAIDTLEAALAKIGYRLRVVKLPEIEAKAQKRAIKRRAS
jgi:hypothetical protein